jgi:hypothetical protein
MRDHGSDSYWDDFKQILRNTFQSVDLDYRNRVKLTNLKQGSDSNDTYNKNFLRLSTKSPNLRLDNLLFHYTNGLSEKVKYELMSKTQKQWMQLLQSQHNMNIYMLTQDQLSMSSRIKDLLQVVDVLILILLHLISCSYCHKRGHHINDCFSRLKATNSSQSTSNSHSNKSNTSGFSRRPGSSHNPNNHTPHNSGSSDASMSKRKVRGMHCIQTNNSDQLLRVHGTVANVIE